MANTFKLKTKASVGITTTSVYVVPSSTTTVVIGITASNISGNNINVGNSKLNNITGKSHVISASNQSIVSGTSNNLTAGNNNSIFALSNNIWLYCSISIWPIRTERSKSFIFIDCTNSYNVKIISRCAYKMPTAIT